METLHKKVISALTPKKMFFAVRDVTLPTCEVIIDSHISPMKNILGTDFPVVFLFKRKDGMIVFYKPIKEYEEFAKKVGEKCLNDLSYAKKLAKELIEKTDQLNEFLRKNYNLGEFEKKKETFFSQYKEFFAYHQAVYYAGEFAAENNKNPNSIQIVEVLRKAYQYNETVVPNIEKYFKSLLIGELLISEIGIGKTKPNKDRSILYFEKKKIVLDYPQANEIHEGIQEKYVRYLSKITVVEGISACKGKVKGVARVITDLSEQKSCKEGEILIIPQTRPQYNLILSKLKAIVTDEGGMLCHAAMLAREKNIPCIVGTKNATKIIKTGDNVIVNADRGLVKVLK